MLDLGAPRARRPPPAFIGRDRELAWCAQAFSRHRVLAICGLAGIGKTSLLLTAAHAQARRVGGVVAYHVCDDGERIGDVLAELLAEHRATAPRTIPLRTALDQVEDAARRSPLVLCIDDAHRISDALLLDVLAHLDAVSAPLWLVVASRRQFPVPDTDIDGAVLRLGPLSADGARAVWRDLEDRFGPSITRFDALDATRLGSPFALRRAFATGLAGDAEGVDLTGLDPAHAALLAQICAFAGPVEVDRLAAVVPDLMAALPALVQALLVDVPEAGTITVHDLVRASVARSPRPAETAEHLVCLRLYEASDRDPLARLRHTVGSQQWSAAAALIDRMVRPHYGFFPMGAAVERQLLAAFDALEGARLELPLALRLARLQLTARHGDGRAVFQALRNEAAREPAAWAHLGTVELLIGDACAAELHIRQALADPVIAGPVAHTFLLGILLESLRRQGRVDALREAILDFQSAAAKLGPIAVSVAQVVIAAMTYDQEDYEGAARRLAAVRGGIAALTFVPALHATHALLERATGAAVLDRPDEVSPLSTVTRALFEDVDFFRATLLLFAADGDVFEGNVAEAEARARDAEAIALRGGYRGIQHWAVYVRAECLLMRGLAVDAAELAAQGLADPLMTVHRRQRQLFLAVSARSLWQLGRTAEARSQVRSIDDFAHAPVNAARLAVLPWITPVNLTSDLARAEFALAQLEQALSAGSIEPALHWRDAAQPVAASRWQYLRARLAVLDAELAVRSGDAARAERALATAEALCARCGYRREHAKAALVAVALAYLAGDRDRATHWAGVAAERAAVICPDIEAVAAKLRDGSAAAGQHGDPWMDRLDLAAPRAFRLREPATVHYLTRRQADAVRFADGTFGVDALRHMVHVGGAPRSLARRPGLWSVLLALLANPGRVTSPDELARHAWGVSYHAVRHHSRLVVSIKRLRDALGDGVIAAVGGGYRLSVDRWAVLEPVNRGAGPANSGPSGEP